MSHRLRVDKDLPGWPQHRENRENGQKEFPSGKTQGICKNHQNTGKIQGKKLTARKRNVESERSKERQHCWILKFTPVLKGERMLKICYWMQRKKTGKDQENLRLSAPLKPFFPRKPLAWIVDHQYWPLLILNTRLWITEPDLSFWKEAKLQYSWNIPTVNAPPTESFETWQADALGLSRTSGTLPMRQYAHTAGPQCPWISCILLDFDYKYWVNGSRSVSFSSFSPVFIARHNGYWWFTVNIFWNTFKFIKTYLL